MGERHGVRVVVTSGAHARGATSERFEACKGMHNLHSKHFVSPTKPHTKFLSLNTNNPSLLATTSSPRRAARPS